MCDLCHDTGRMEVATEEGYEMIPCPNHCVSFTVTDMKDASQDEDEYERA